MEGQRPSVGRKAAVKKAADVAHAAKQAARSAAPFQKGVCSELFEKGSIFVNNFIFENSTKVIFGQGCVKEYLACKVKPCQTILLAYGGGSIQKNGIYQEVTSILENAGKTVVEFSGIQPNPTYAKVLEGAKLAREHNVDMILAVGAAA